MADIQHIIEKQREFYHSGATRSVSFRLDSLRRLKEAVIKNQDDIARALNKDLSKAPFESYAAEIGIVLDELGYAIGHLAKWAKPRHVGTPLVHFPSSGLILPEPYGVSLIMSPWNYPFNLTMVPLVGSLAAGNCTIIKPSAYSPATSSVIAKLISENFDEGHVAVIEGGREANKELLGYNFDYIFFTGSVAVGKVVMEAASHNLTPVTLELGGKSPCIVLKDANLKLAAKRIMWGKLLNAGQTCVAPDYLLVQKDVKKELLGYMKEAIRELFGDDPCANPDYPKIINAKHFSRVLGLVSPEKMIEGGRSDEKALKIAPVLLDNITWQDPAMQQEIFGPVLPVLEFDEPDEVIDMVGSHPKPLAFYLFSGSKANQRRMIENISFGGGCINDTMVHLATTSLPFGGVGDSGMGSYHGEKSFETFSHLKSVLTKSNTIDIKLRYAPYGDHLKLLKKLMK
ncbi:MAG: aldehyde dehydrogenase [Clostridia bacterium]|nr:aldehyde dehydrogenase [Clostridia bacterium]